MKNSIVISSLMTVLLTLSNPANAQDITWSGNGNSDNSGDWSEVLNWDGGIVPTADERAILPSVSSGTRTVTQDIASGYQVNALRFQQAGTVGVSKLSLGGNITLTKTSNRTDNPASTSSALQWALTDGATHDQIIVDMNGYSIIVTNSPGSSAIGGSLGGTINFNQPGSSIHTFYLGHVYFNVHGKILATADGFIGRSMGSTNASGLGLITFMVGSEVKVTNGAAFGIDLNGKRNTDKAYTFTNNGKVIVDAGSVFFQKVTAPSGSTGTMTLVFENVGAGTIDLAGNLHLRTSAATSGNLTVRNAGVWTIIGTEAGVTRLTTTIYPASIRMPVFTNQAKGILRGSSAADCLEFDEEESDGTRRMPIFNSGKIVPGAGSAAEDLASVGLLTLRDIDVVMEEAGVIELDIGGAKETEMDRLVLAKGLNDPADDAGTLDLTEGGTLQLVTANEYDHRASFRQPVIKAGAVTGEFTTVKLDGETFTDNELELANGTSYKVVYEADAVWLYCFGIDNQTTILIY